MLLAAILPPGCRSTGEAAGPSGATSVSLGGDSGKGQVVLTLVGGGDVAMADRARYALAVVARNGGSQPVDLRLPRSTLLVNGAPLAAWAETIGNGTTDRRVARLPPGEEVRVERVVGADLLPAPGGYVVVLRLADGAESPPLTIRVTP